MLRSYGLMIGVGIFFLVIGFSIFLAGCSIKEESSETTFQEGRKKEIYRENVDEFDLKPNEIRKLYWVSP